MLGDIQRIHQKPGISFSSEILGIAYEICGISTSSCENLVFQNFDSKYLVF